MAGWPTTIAAATAGGIGGSGDFNNHADALRAVGNGWSAYTPTLAANTTSPTLGTSVLTGRYRKTGHTADIHINLLVGSGWDPGAGAWNFSLPSSSDALGVVTPLLTNASEVMGFATARDVLPSPTSRGLFVYRFSSAAVGLIASADGVPLGPGAPFTWASGDLISIHIPSLEIN